MALFSSKKQNEFFDLLSKISKNLDEASHYFIEFKIQNVSDLKVFSQSMKEYERKGDSFMHELIILLNKTFITPIEREDILQLANKMDDVLDGLEQFSARLDMLSFTDIDDKMKKFSDKIHEGTLEITKAIQLLFTKKLIDIRQHTIKINDLESECDDIHFTAMKELFEKEKDPISLIKHKELYESLEEIADSCEDVADTLESIIMRNS